MKTLKESDVVRFWLEHSNIIDAESELVIEIGEGKRFKYQKTYESERFYNYLRGLDDFAEFAGKYIRKSAVKKIQLNSNLANSSIWIRIYGYKNPLEIGSDLRMRRSDIGMFDTFEYLKKIFNH